jgi:dTDP-4-dehydrorhamnose 3,5-epimerase
MIDGVLLTPERRIAQPKGDILHAMKCSSPGFRAFGEAYFSTILAGEIKGWKKHLRVTLNLVVPVGQVSFAIRDEREGSLTRHACQTVTLGPETLHARLTVSPRLWVAFRGGANPSSVLLNIADEEHDPKEAENVPIESFPLPWS